MGLKEVREKVYWDVLLLMVIGTLAINEKLFFGVSVIYYAFLVFRNKWKMYFPKIVGLKLYLLFVLYGTIVGLFLYSVRNVFRDLYYIMPTLIWIFISYHLRIKNKDDKKNMITTLSIYGAIISISCFAKFFVNFSLKFEDLRTIFGTGVYEIGFIFPIVVMETLLLKKIIVSKVLDKVMIIIMTLQIILSFGRIAILEPIIMLCVLVLLVAIYKKQYRKMIFRSAGIIIGLLVILLLVYKVMPGSVTKTFVEKVLYSTEEVNLSQNITSTGDAMSYWRAYEMQAAKEQWDRSNLLVKIMGAGIGKGVFIKYVPHSWREIVVDNEIPLLHNGFFTLLPKGGVFAVVALVLLFWGNVVKGIKLLKEGVSNIEKGIILVGISIAAISNTYVVCGPVQQGAFLTWAILIGWISASIMKDDKEYYDKLTETSSLCVRQTE